MSSLDLLIVKSIQNFVHSFDLFGLNTGWYFMLIFASGIAMRVLDVMSGKKVKK